MNKEQELIGYISAIQTLVDNFPLSMLEYLMSKGKRYTSVLDFLLDIIFYVFGDDISALYDEIVEALFGIQMAAIENTANGLNQIDGLESKTFNKLEDVVKGAIVSILTALLSCSAVPEIPDKHMDSSSGRTSGIVEPLSIPLSTIDLCGKLNINPCHKIGMTYYDNGSGFTSPSTLYKSTDLDAFLWYVLYKGVKARDNKSVSYKEENKMMWDNRREMKYDEDYNRDIITEGGSNRWEDWLSSKLDSEGTLTVKNIQDDSPTTTKYYPILQLEPELGGDVPRFNVLFPAQRYYNYSKTSASVDLKPLMLNHTMYKFNWDYVSSIRIFSVKVILANLLNSLTNGVLSTIQQNPISLSLDMNYVLNRISNIVKNIVMSDDLNVDDCYFEFSNEEYNEMLFKTELQRYGIQTYNAQNGNAVLYDKETIEKSIDSLNESASAITNNKTIQRVLYDVSATAQTGSELTGSLQILQLSSGMNGIIENLIMSLVSPIVMSLLSPKVMLLFILNFEISGLLSLNDILSGNANEILNILYSKIFSILKQVIIYIKDLIVTILLDIFEKEIKPLLTQFMLILLLEKIESWIKLLQEALKCIPIFDINIPKVKSAIDYVNYADIEEEQNKPEKDSNC